MANLECVSGVRVVSMAAADAGLVPNERRHFLEFLAVNVTVAIQIEHPESDLEVALRCCKVNCFLIYQNSFSIREAEEKKGQCIRDKRNRNEPHVDIRRARRFGTLRDALRMSGRVRGSTGQGGK